MSQTVKIHGTLLVKNTTFNFVGQLIPALVAIVRIPYIIHGMGSSGLEFFCWSGLCWGISVCSIWALWGPPTPSRRLFLESRPIPLKR